MPPTIPDPADIKAAVDVALAEDIGTGDFTTKAVIPADTRLNLIMATRQDIVVAGLPSFVSTVMTASGSSRRHHCRNKRRRENSRRHRDRPR